MDTKTVLLALVIGTLLILTHPSHVQADTREPALFGRRAMNPNMNSLFFGKRQSPQYPLRPRGDYLREVCKSMITSCGKYLIQGSAVEQEMAEES